MVIRAEEGGCLWILLRVEGALLKLECHRFGSDVNMCLISGHGIVSHQVKYLEEKRVEPIKAKQ